MIRTCDPVIRSKIMGTASGYGCDSLLTFVTGCSRRGVHVFFSLPNIPRRQMAQRLVIVLRCTRKPQCGLFTHF
jgi:hypothetical protein